MKSLTLFLLVILTLSSCKDTNQTAVENENTVKNTDVAAAAVTPESKPQSKGNLLCKINGKDWAYTKASGIVASHPRTKQRTAVMTFKKKLEKGSESVQLTYDADTKKLIGASLILKAPDKEGKLSTVYYTFTPAFSKKSPNIEFLGAIDLSDPLTASGTGEVKNLDIRFEGEKLKNTEDAIVNVTDIKFAGVGYSNLDK